MADKRPVAKWRVPRGSPGRVLVTIPHSGEALPVEASWLRNLPTEVLTLDLDRYVDELYGPVLEELQWPTLVAQVHRYAVDLNRFPEDVDADSVAGAPLAAGTHPKGIHWVVSTQGHRILPSPLPRELHEQWVREYHDTFHDELRAEAARMRASLGSAPLWHLDLHSMPSRGTAAHADGGQERPEVVVSDFNGKAASEAFMNRVCSAFEGEGFEVSRNWPYQGGRITQRYGRPDQGHETIQIELNRKLYLDESTREKGPAFARMQERLGAVLRAIQDAG